MAHHTPLSMDFPGKNTEVGCHFLLWGIFLTQGSNLCLLHWQVDSLPLSPRQSQLPSTEPSKGARHKGGIQSTPQSKHHSMKTSFSPQDRLFCGYRCHSPSTETEGATHPLQSNNLRARRALGHNLILTVKANICLSNFFVLGTTLF